MSLERDSHCHRCGSKYPQIERYPRACGACQNQVWANPIPVSVVIVPVLHEHAGTTREGVLVVRRSIMPQKGLLALAGGFLEETETWQEGGAREIQEETGIAVDSSGLSPFWFTSTEPKPNRVLLFSSAKPISSRDFPVFSPSNETSERGLVFGPDGLEEIMAFPLHIQAVRRWFEQRNIRGPSSYSAA